MDRIGKLAAASDQYVAVNDEVRALTKDAAVETCPQPSTTCRTLLVPRASETHYLRRETRREGLVDAIGTES